MIIIEKCYIVLFCMCRYVCVCLRSFCPGGIFAVKFDIFSFYCFFMVYLGSLTFFSGYFFLMQWGGGEKNGSSNETNTTNVLGELSVHQILTCRLKFSHSHTHRHERVRENDAEKGWFFFFVSEHGSFHEGFFGCWKMRFCFFFSDSLFCWVFDPLFFSFEKMYGRSIRSSPGLYRPRVFRSARLNR